MNRNHNPGQKRMSDSQALSVTVRREIVTPHPSRVRLVTTVAEIMARDVLSVGPRASLVEAAQRMQDRYVGSALVFEDEQLRGILTERDLLRAVASGRIEGETVEDWMTRHPETIEPADSTGLAGTLMIHGGFRHLPVLEDGQIVGIVSIRDLMRITLDDHSPRGA